LAALLLFTDRIVAESKKKTFYWGETFLIRRIYARPPLPRQKRGVGAAEAKRNPASGLKKELLDVQKIFGFPFRRFRASGGDVQAATFIPRSLRI
jgi:hypothetical protein